MNVSANLQTPLFVLSPFSITELVGLEDAFLPPYLLDDKKEEDRILMSRLINVLTPNSPRTKTALSWNTTENGYSYVAYSYKTVENIDRGAQMVIKHSECVHKLNTIMQKKPKLIENFARDLRDSIYTSLEHLGFDLQSRDTYIMDFSVDMLVHLVGGNFNVEIHDRGAPAGKLIFDITRDCRVPTKSLPLKRKNLMEKSTKVMHVPVNANSFVMDPIARTQLVGLTGAYLPLRSFAYDPCVAPSRALLKLVSAALNYLTPKSNRVKTALYWKLTDVGNLSIEYSWKDKLGGTGLSTVTGSVEDLESKLSDNIAKSESATVFAEELTRLLKVKLSEHGARGLDSVGRISVLPRSLLVMVADLFVLSTDNPTGNLSVAELPALDEFGTVTVNCPVKAVWSIGYDGARVTGPRKNVYLSDPEARVVIAEGFDIKDYDIIVSGDIEICSNDQTEEVAEEKPSINGASLKVIDAHNAFKTPETHDVPQFLPIEIERVNPLMNLYSSGNRDNKIPMESLELLVKSLLHFGFTTTNKTLDSLFEVPESKRSSYAVVERATYDGRLFCLHFILPYGTVETLTYSLLQQGK